MGTVAQRWARRGRDLAGTATARGLQLASVGLGAISPAAQTRVVRGVQVGLEVHAKSREDLVGVYAAALTYSCFLSILPLALVGLSIAGLMVDEIGAPGWLERVIEEVPGSSELLQEELASLRAARAGLGVVGLVGALWAGSALTSRAQGALDRIFGGGGNLLVERARALGVSIALGALLLATTGAVSAVSGSSADGAIALPVTLAIRVALAAPMLGYWMLAYRLLTSTRGVSLRDHLSGAIWMTVGFELLRVVGGWYVGGFVARASAVYGAMGAIFGLLVFIRLAMWLFLYGAEISSILRRRLGPRSGEPDLRRHRPQAGDAHGQELVER